MSDSKLFLKKYSAIILVIVVLLSAAAVVYGFGALKAGPFNKYFSLEEPTFFSKSDGGKSYIINSSGKSIVAVDGNYNYLFSIDGGKRNSDFYYATDITADKSGNLYVLDRIIAENGKDISSERIARYDKNGKFQGYIYELGHEDSDSLTIRIFAVNIFDGKLFFVQKNSDGFSLVGIDLSTENIVTEKAYIYKDAEILISDFTISPELEVCFSTRKGDIWHAASDGSFSCIYSGNEHIKDGFPSLPSAVKYDHAGNLYFNDMSHRVIYKLSKTENGFESEPVISIEQGEPLPKKPDEFSSLPIYSGMSVDAENSVSVTYSDNYYDEVSGEEIYTYNIYVKGNDDGVVFNGGSLLKSTDVLIKGYICTAFLFIGAVALILLIIKFIKAMSKVELSTSSKLQLTFVSTSLIVTAIVSAIIINQVNTRYYDEVMNKISNFTAMIGNSLNEEDINNINTPSDFMNESYNNISASIESVVHNELNAKTGVYCILYKVQNGVVCGIYSDDKSYGSFYPMPGSYEESAEQYIYDTGETLTSFAHNSAEGQYMLALGPVYDSEKNVIALIEVGTDLYSFNASSNKLFFNIVLYVTMIVLVAGLLFTEIITLSGIMKKRKECKRTKSFMDSSLIRPIIFLLFFAGNISTAFMPIFGKSLWTPEFGMPVEIAAALPISAELCLAVISGLIAGFAVDKTGAKALCIAGALFYMSGNVVAGFASSLWILIAGGALCGIGGGMIALSVNTYIAGYNDNTVRNRGFANYNAAFLSGMNCGTVIGSIIAENFGYKPALITAAAVALFSVVFIIFCMEKHKIKKEHKEAPSKNRMSIVKFLLTPEVQRYFLFMLVPYLVCASFLTYFFPIFGEEHGLTATHISMAFLMSGVISIYLGPALTEYICKRFGTGKSMIFASIIYAVSLMLFAVKPSIVTCFVVIAVLSVADSFGLTAQSVYYTDIKETKILGEGRAMGINGVYENIAQMIGPIIFGGALLLGYKKGIMLIVSIVTGLLLLFIISSRANRSNSKSAVTSGQREAEIK